MYQQANSLFPAGVCPYIGVAGHLLGGGSGFQIRRHGLACDSLIALRMVTFEAEVITASADANPDLVWASCGGGGGNLGIVTSFNVKTTPLSEAPVVTVAQLRWGADKTVQVFDTVQRWAPEADRKLNAQVLVGCGRVIAYLQWEGSRDQAMQEFGSAGLMSIPGIQIDRLTEGGWIDDTLAWASNSVGANFSSISDLSNGQFRGQQTSFQAASSYNQQLMSMEGIQAMAKAVNAAESGKQAIIGNIFLKVRSLRLLP